MAALVGVVVCARVTCDGCATSFAVRRLADALPCPRCGEAVALGLDVLGAELGGEDVLRPPFEDPTCPACDDRFAVDELHVGLGADTVACPRCGAALAVRAAPPPLAASGFAYLVGEDLAGAGDGAAAGDDDRAWIALLEPDALDVALAAAAAPDTPPATLTTLAGHVAPIVRARVAAHPATPAAALEALAADPDPDVRDAVAASPTTSPEILAALARADAGSWAATASPRLPAHVIEELAASPHGWIRSAVAANPAATPATLTRLAADPEIDVRVAVAGNPAAPAAALVALAADPSTRVRVELVRSPAAPAAALEAVARTSDVEVDHDRGTTLHLLLAGRADAPAAALAVLASSRRVAVRVAVARHRGTAPAVLKRLARDRSDDVELSAKLNPACPSWWRRLW